MLADCNPAIELNALQAQAYFNCAAIWKYKGELDKAITDYNRAIKLAPQHAAAWALRRLLLMLQGREAAAQKDFVQCLLLNKRLERTAASAAPLASQY